MSAMNLADYVDQAHGRQTELAKLLRCPPQLVWQWSRGTRPVPALRATAIEVATGGAVKRWDLRPNDWWLLWPELRKAKGAPKIPEQEGV
jgi:DNA-binding transcriptional regulator YdaS (Cro superfamily)